MTDLELVTIEAPLNLKTSFTLSPANISHDSQSITNCDLKGLKSLLVINAFFNHDVNYSLRNSIQLILFLSRTLSSAEIRY